MNLRIFRARLLILFGIISVLTSCAKSTSTSEPPTLIPSLTPIPLTIELPSPTPELTSTPTNTNPVWEIKENWSAANQIRAMLIEQNGDLWTGGPAGIVHWDLKTNTPTVYAIQSDPEHTNVTALSQTPDGSIWAGTDGNGLARFDGTRWQSFTTDDGLPGNFIKDQTVTPNGELWLDIKKNEFDYEPDQEFYFGRFDGKTWIELNGAGFTWIVASPNGSIIGGQAAANLSAPSSDLILDDGHTWTSLVYDEQKSNPLRAKAITAIKVAPDEAIWVATRFAIFRYLNKGWVKIGSPLDGEDLPPVSSIAVSANGTAWFGFSADAADFNKCGARRDYVEEQGVYRYDGKTWKQFTTKDGLIDNKICALTVDQNNNVWFGSFDKGVSRFDGKTWTSYVVP